MFIKYLLIFSLIFTSIACAESKEVKCSKLKGIWNERCQDIELEKNIGKYWKEMKQFYFDLQVFVKNNDKKSLSKMMEYPFTLFYPSKDATEDDWPRKLEKIEIKDEEEFIKKYDFIFTKNLKWALKNQRYQDLLIFKNVLHLHYQYGDIVISKDCDFSKISHEECSVIKIFYINNDIVPLPQNN
ncbi:MAG: hypothetical protein J0H68_08685 [Sphingobacteriia bacterium]|nr:hypothetical protein [Sphingobacteriia bacterium]